MPYCRLLLLPVPDLRKEHDSRDQDSTKEEKYIRADGPFITLLRPLSDQEISEWNYNAK